MSFWLQDFRLGACSPLRLIRIINSTSKTLHNRGVVMVGLCSPLALVLYKKYMVYSSKFISLPAPFGYILNKHASWQTICEWYLHRLPTLHIIKFMTLRVLLFLLFQFFFAHLSVVTSGYSGYHSRWAGLGAVFQRSDLKQVFMDADAEELEILGAESCVAQDSEAEMRDVRGLVSLVHIRYHRSSGSQSSVPRTPFPIPSLPRWF